jgi:Surface lipoprotein assembly modifier
VKIFKLRYSYLLSLLLFTNISLYADSVQELFEKGDYVNGCDKVDKLFLQETADFNLNLYYGICADYRGDTDAAMAAFDRAEILSEANALVHKHLGDLYARMGNIEIANDEYDKADRFGNAPFLRADVKGYEANRFSLLLHLSIGGDSNVGYDPNLSDISEWYSTPIGSENKPQASLFTKEYLRISHVYDSDPFSSFYFKTQLYAYNKTYDKFHDEDLFQGQVFSGPGWASKSFDFWLPFSYAYTAVGAESFSEQYSIEPQIRKRFENKLLLTLGAKYEIEHYKQWDEGDRLMYSGRIALSRWFNHNYFRLAYAHFIAEKNDEESPRLFLDQYYNEIDLSYIRVISSSIEAGIGYLYRKSNYEDLARFALAKKREDELNEYSAYISYDLTQSTGLIFQYEYYDNKSNYTPSDYTKEVISLGFYLYI